MIIWSRRGNETVSIARAACRVRAISLVLAARCRRMVMRSNIVSAPVRTTTSIICRNKRGLRWRFRAQVTQCAGYGSGNRGIRYRILPLFSPGTAGLRNRPRPGPRGRIVPRGLYSQYFRASSDCSFISAAALHPIPLIRDRSAGSASNTFQRLRSGAKSSCASALVSRRRAGVKSRSSERLVLLGRNQARVLKTVFSRSRCPSWIGNTDHLAGE